jgi:diamine N-acetyltransferase
MDRQVRMMIENEQHEVVGIVDVVNFDPSNCRAEVGLIILDAFRRQGYGCSTLQAVTQYSLSVLHLHQLFAFIDKTNEPSIHLFQKMGYETSATIKDWLYDGVNYRDAVLMQRVF